jgi:NAD(P)-dependent dehydrogenase (short-subunit alcohol dehydrogenase family)
MDYQLKGKTAFVAAGAHGIGEAIADLLTQEGAVVVVADQDGDVLKEKASKWHGVFAGDLATAKGVEASVAHALKAFGGAPDILINNLGVGNPYGLEEQTDEGWAQSFQVNLMGTVRVCRALVPKMAAKGAGAVVNTGSDLAKQPEPAFLDYGACKSALLYLTKAMAKRRKCA